MEGGARLVRSGEKDADVAISDAFSQVASAVEDGEAPNSRYERDRLVEEGLGVILGLRQREPGLLFGYGNLDERTSGMHPGHMTCIAARSAIGKTVLAGDVGRNVALKQDTPVVFFSLEMSPADLIQRRAAAELSIPYSDIRENTLSADQRERVYKFAEREAENRNFRVEFVPGATAGEIHLLARKAVRDMGARPAHRRHARQDGRDGLAPA
jgi:replicative DNA helicase